MTVLGIVVVAVVLFGYSALRSCAPLLKLRPNQPVSLASDDFDAVTQTPVAEGYPTIPAAYLGYDSNDGSKIVPDWSRPLTSVDIENKPGRSLDTTWQTNLDQVVQVKEGIFYLFIYPASRCPARLLESGNWDPNSSVQPKTDYLRDVDTSKGPAACFVIQVNAGQQYVFIDEEASGLTERYGWLVEYHSAP